MSIFIELTRLVEQFRKHPDRSFRTNDLNDFSGATLHQAIVLAAPSSSKQHKIHRHLRWVGYKVLAVVQAQLLANQNSLRECKDFDVLHSRVETLLRGSLVPGAGRLTVYDVADRIGISMGPRHRPTSIYLKAGTGCGVRNLEKLMQRKFQRNANGTISPAQLPKPLCKMPADELEDFFCVMASSIANLRP